MSQTSKMKTCAANYKKAGKPGNYRGFMSNCLSGGRGRSTPKRPARGKGPGRGSGRKSPAFTQAQSRMRGCNAQIRGAGLNKQQRNSFMSSCLRGAVGLA